MMRKKRALVIVCLVCFLIAAAGYQLFLSPRWELPILMYHYIDQGEGSLYVSPENFEKQMAYLARRGFKVISMVEFIDGLRQGRQFDRKTVVITFDDGERNNYTKAFPILRKHGFPAMFFVETGFIDNEKYLTRSQILEMAEHNMDFGGHTQNKAYLPKLSKDRMVHEINAPKQDLEEILGKEIKFFSYPVGGFNEKVKEVVRKAGYAAAFTTNRGSSTAHSDIYALKRVKVTNSDAVKPFHFWGKLSGYYNVFRRFRSGS